MGPKSGSGGIVCVGHRSPMKSKTMTAYVENRLGDKRIPIASSLTHVITDRADGLDVPIVIGKIIWTPFSGFFGTVDKSTYDPPDTINFDLIQ